MLLRFYMVTKVFWMVVSSVAKFVVFLQNWTAFAG